MGAWIEPEKIDDPDLSLESHPSWVRGLKPIQRGTSTKEKLSHPSWVRGLKLSGIGNDAKSLAVAPFMGAWIETY